MRRRTDRQVAGSPASDSPACSATVVQPGGLICLRLHTMAQEATRPSRRHWDGPEIAGAQAAPAAVPLLVTYLRLHAATRLRLQEATVTAASGIAGTRLQALTTGSLTPSQKLLVLTVRLAPQSLPTVTVTVTAETQTRSEISRVAEHVHHDWHLNPAALLQAPSESNWIIAVYSTCRATDCHHDDDDLRRVLVITIS